MTVTLVCGARNPLKICRFRSRICFGEEVGPRTDNQANFALTRHNHQGDPMADSNIQIAQQIYAAFGRGDVPGIMEHISEDLRHFGAGLDPVSWTD
jgi:hypothetical protein